VLLLRLIRYLSGGVNLHVAIPDFSDDPLTILNPAFSIKKAEEVRFFLETEEGRDSEDTFSLTITE
jgi:hypothetical protein